MLLAALLQRGGLVGRKGHGGGGALLLLLLQLPQFVRKKGNALIQGNERDGTCPGSNDVVLEQEINLLNGCSAHLDVFHLEAPIEIIGLTFKEGGDMDADHPSPFIDPDDGDLLAVDFLNGMGDVEGWLGDRENDGAISRRLVLSIGSHGDWNQAWVFLVHLL